MRQIKASEVKPGMVVRWESRGFTHEGTVERVTSGTSLYTTRFINGHFGINTPSDAPVTVLAEPQPEEPTEFGARVRVRDGRFVRLDDYAAGVVPWSEKGTGAWWSWDDLCEMGPVTVVPDQGWEVPDDTETAPEVPDRIEEWGTWEDVPEGVVVTTPGLFCHYRKNQGVVEFSDPDDDPDWTEPGVRTMPRGYGPWTRVSDV